MRLKSPYVCVYHVGLIFPGFISYPNHHSLQTWFKICFRSSFEWAKKADFS